MKKGFTLVELSIVLVIIGLLIGGILVGQSLIDSAKTTALISQLQQYEIAFGQYYSAYKYLPGDSPKMSSWSADCSYCWAGNGDGYTAYNDYLGAHESFYAWRTLQQTGMLKTDSSYSGVWAGDFGTNYITTTADKWVGKSIPEAKFDKGKSIGIDVRAYFMGTESGNDIYMQYAPQCKTVFLIGKANPAFMGWGVSPQFTDGAFTPADALALDKKLDDGNAAIGSLIATYSNPLMPAGKECFTEGNVNTYDPTVPKTYNANSPDSACVLYYCLGNIAANIR